MDGGDVGDLLAKTSKASGETGHRVWTMVRFKSGKFSVRASYSFLRLIGSDPFLAGAV